MQTITIVTVFTLIGVAIAAVFKCPDGYLSLLTGCYQFTNQSNITWCHAYLICKLELNGYLVEIEDQKEQEALKAHIKGVVDPSSTYDWWIGGGDILTEGDYRWMTSGDKATYLPWYSQSDPNDAPPGEDCIGISTNLDFKWRDYWCDIGSFQGRSFRAICEANPTDC